MLEIGFLCLNGPGREKSMGKIREKQLFSEFPFEAEIPEVQKKDTKCKRDFVIII